MTPPTRARVPTTSIGSRSGLGRVSIDRSIGPARCVFELHGFLSSREIFREREGGGSVMSRDRWSTCPTLVDKEKAHVR